MAKIIGVKFRNVGKVYYFDPGDLEIHYNDHVIVETAYGINYGTVLITPMEIPDDKVPAVLRPVIRMADEKDDEREKRNREKEQEAYHICKEKIYEHGLNMKLIAAEYTFDNSKLLFYFTADGRIDFRELVKDLAGIFKVRIELRQIGVRDETKLLGGYGTCGRPLCCHTWLKSFQPVSIKMAKEQNLSLNPSKISGTCGRLMCCLKNEAETYAYLNQGMPAKGDYVTTPDGLHGDVQSVNILRQTVRVVVELENDEKELQEFNVKDITFVPKAKKPKNTEQKPAVGNKPEKSRAAQAGAEKGRAKSGRGAQPVVFEKAVRGKVESTAVRSVRKRRDIANEGAENVKTAPQRNELVPASAGQTETTDNGGMLIKKTTMHVEIEMNTVSVEAVPPDKADAAGRRRRRKRRNNVQRAAGTQVSGKQDGDAET